MFEVPFLGVTETNIVCQQNSLAVHIIARLNTTEILTFLMDASQFFQEQVKGQPDHVPGAFASGH